MYRYGILSTASIVDRFVEGIRQSKKGCVEAIASRTIEKAKEKAEKLNIHRYYGTYQELFEDNQIDVIYIPTVNGFHYRDCRQALLHGKHVIVEKPFCLKTSEAKELFQIAKDKKLFLMEAQKAVFLPVTKKVKDIIESKTIGDVSYIELKAGFPQRFTYDHWMYDLSLGGGSLYGSATYTIEYMQYVFDNPDFIMDGMYIPSVTGSDDICHFQLKINNQILVASTISMNIPLQNEAVFYGEKGYIVVPNYWKADRCALYLYNGEHQHFEFSTQSEFVYEINHIHDCLDQHLLQSPVMNEKKTIQTVQMVEELYRKWKGK